LPHDCPADRVAECLQLFYSSSDLHNVSVHPPEARLKRRRSLSIELIGLVNPYRVFGDHLGALKHSVSR
jgi:hypothetical protein